jgi:hypothetical protein
MLSTDTSLKIICSMVINAVLFGITAVTVLSVPVLNAHAKYLIPSVVILSFALAPVIAHFIAPRMRVRNWGKDGWRAGDVISG